MQRFPEVSSHALEEALASSAEPRIVIAQFYSNVLSDEESGESRVVGTLLNSSTSRARLFGVDASEYPETTENYAFASVPTFIVFSAGVEMTRLSSPFGLTEEADFLREVASILALSGEPVTRNQTSP